MFSVYERFIEIQPNVSSYTWTEKNVITTSTSNDYSPSNAVARRKKGAQGMITYIFFWSRLRTLAFVGNIRLLLLLLYHLIAYIK